MLRIILLPLLMQRLRFLLCHHVPPERIELPTRWLKASNSAN